jgi:hypothetical protein
MRKYGVFITAALLALLAACAGLPSAEPSVSPSETPTAETSPAQSSPTVTGGTQSGGVLLPNGPLPESDYAPPSPPARFYADVTLSLIPRDAYGRIWPYVGGYITQMWMDGELYGLCDESGRIVCDPAYNKVELIEKDGQRLYKLTKYEQDENYRNTSKITLAKLDGSWAEEYDDVETMCYSTEFASDRVLDWRENVVYEYITMCRDGKWGVIDTAATRSCL